MAGGKTSARAQEKSGKLMLTGKLNNGMKQDNSVP